MCKNCKKLINVILVHLDNIYSGVEDDDFIDEINYILQQENLKIRHYSDLGESYGYILDQLTVTL